MATYDEVIQALRNADAQGNVEDAKALAQIANSMRQQASVAKTEPVAEQPSPPTTSQNIYKSVREVITPTVEAVGAIGGGLLGAPLGPMGAVGGADRKSTRLNSSHT